MQVCGVIDWSNVTNRDGRKEGMALMMLLFLALSAVMKSDEKSPPVWGGGLRCLPEQDSDGPKVEVDEILGFCEDHSAQASTVQGSGKAHRA